MYDKFTPEQKNAVNAEGSVIVTAAAGSGKTAVLTERVIHALKYEDVSADRLLIVTFTNLAAAEMRSRIEKRLNEECENNPENIHLLKQKLLISSADICTIDSFCIRLLKNNFSLLSISPDFKIADPIVETTVSHQVISKLFKEEYDKKDADFLEFLKSTDSVYSDDNAAERVLSLYNNIMSLPFYNSWLNKMLKEYEPDNFAASKWADTLYTAVKESFTQLAEMLNLKKDEFSTDPKAKEHLTPYIKSYLLFLDTCIGYAEEKDFENLQKNIINPPQKPQFKIKYAPELKETAKALFNRLNDGIAEFLPVFKHTLDDIKKEFVILNRLAEKLVYLVKEFDKRYFEELTKKGYLTFQLSEQLAFKLLCKEVDGKFVPTEFSKEITSLYDRVMVDEYQDVNSLQNTLFEILSENRKKLFTVGDAKQSIYGFRNANPDFFIEQSNKATMYTPQLDSDVLKRIVLSTNFRSRKGICDFVNGFFSLSMSEKFGGMKYNSFEMLNPKDDFPPTEEKSVEIFLNGKKSPEATAEEIAKYIKKSVLNEMKICHKGKNNQKEFRNANYGDFAVLFRTGTKFSVYYDIFKEYNIPVSISNGNFFEAKEIKCIISILTAINSPLNDTAMLSLLMSPIFGFSAEDIAVLKLKDRNARLYKLITQDIKNPSSKFTDFYKTFNLYRQKAACLPIGEFISFIYEKSNIKSFYSSLDNGEIRLNNLIYFEQIAADFCGEFAGDLYEFLNHLKFLEKSGQIKFTDNIKENCVKFLTMHKSKGLQFPVVIVAESSSNFNTQNTEDELITDRDLGFSFNRLDEDTATKYIPTPKKIMNMNVLKKAREEELRLLYVVMTRPEEKLVFFIPNTGTNSSPLNVSANLLKCYLDPQKGISPKAFTSCKNFASWLGMYLLMLPEFSDIRKEFDIDESLIPLFVKENAPAVGLNILNDDDKPDADLKISENENSSANDNIDYKNELKEIFNFVYPYSELREIEAKTSVSRLAKKDADRQFCATSRPSFMANEGLSPTERGTALHKFMQYANFSLAKENPKAEIERLCRLEFISKAEADVINPEKIEKFVTSNIFKRLLASDRLLREQRFLLSVPAKEIKKDLSENIKDEKVIIQGAIDCMFFEGDNIILIDFKTDRTNDEDFLIKHYTEQLKIYSIAASQIFGKTVTECYIYSLNMSKWIKIDL